jgi:hypothetical protein
MPGLAPGIAVLSLRAPFEQTESLQALYLFVLSHHLIQEPVSTSWDDALGSERNLDDEVRAAF